MSDAVTTLGSGVDGAVRRIETAYDGQGHAYLVTSYSAASGGSVVNQVQRAFNGLGQLVTEWQAHGGAVNTSTTPKVQYAYSEMPSGANHSRLTSVTYPDGYVLTYNYASGLNDGISRLTSLSDSTGTLEAYSYLGLGTVVVRAHPQPNVDLSYAKRSGEGVGDAGDQYTGLDRFGRVVGYETAVTTAEQDDAGLRPATKVTNRTRSPRSCPTARSGFAPTPPFAANSTRPATAPPPSPTPATRSVGCRPPRPTSRSTAGRRAACSARPPAMPLTATRTRPTPTS